MTAEEVAQRLDAKRSGKGWIARCPAHDDRSPSLSVGEASDGRLLLFCHAGCEFLDILAAIGISEGTCHKPDQEKRVRFSPEKKDDRRWRTLPDAMQECTPTGYTLTVWYFYSPTYVRVRYEKPSESGGKPEKVFLPFREIKPGEWANFAPPAPRPLFRVADILARPDETVHYAEGEKCARALYVAGYLATTCGGQSSDSSTDFTPLAGRSVVVWPDNDQKGIEHAHRVATKLQKLGCIVKVMPIPEGAAPHSDVVDWFGLKPYGDVLAMVRQVFPNAKLI